MNHILILQHQLTKGYTTFRLERLCRTQSVTEASPKLLHISSQVLSRSNGHIGCT